ncbi:MULTISPECIES: RNA degradosome polyphosphate kinase [Bacillaceae]|uniref:Polyphosphate kinase n=1 Tax=Evansella alkalicola TaxID=745819 RepID=A0ABS6JV56_9BACI|nr:MULTISPECIES: RNA degradosome polyphosphate kinase [Bacillaceae]MBU9722471.1 RNA degradosome polyphosphate kinase [Bacillus alkalicola]
MGYGNKHSVDHPEHFNNRELSWLGFNKRVLQEAIDERNPLLERLKFLAIFSSNLDEFFMVRVAGLKDQVKAGYDKPEETTAMTPKEQLMEISRYTHHLITLQDSLFTDSLKPHLHDAGIELLEMDEITHDHYNYLSNHFDEFIKPVLTPLAIDAYRPFPMLMNKSLNLAVTLESDGKKITAIVQVPAVLDRYISLPPVHHQDRCYVLLEDVITTFIHRLFNGNVVSTISPFRITRNADLTIHEEGAQDLLVEIEKELKKRKWGAAVRLEIKKGAIPEDDIDYLSNVMNLEKDDIFEVTGPIDYTFLTEFAKTLSEDRPDLVYKPTTSRLPLVLRGEENIFDTLQKRDIFFHHPYDSFQPIIDLMIAAAKDPNVLAIKQTLYRVSGDSPIIQALEEAAHNGKQVTVLVEIKARFDEENNIQWAKKLEKAGVHVIYGITGLKTHSKITLIVRQHHDEIQRFVHLGTGNYNDKTAKLYTDMGLLTAKRTFGEDATNFFNHLSGYSEKPDWHEFSTAPFEIRDTFLQLIQQEIEHQKVHGNGHIIAKMNSLTDKPIMLKLYEASNAGVRIDLIVRGICCLKPGIPGVSENITVRSILDRFLEHSRIYWFHQNGKEATFLSSADWMTRNMEKRIEVLFPVYDKGIKERIKKILLITLADNVKARIQQSDGNYEYVNVTKEDSPIQSQLIFTKDS